MRHHCDKKATLEIEQHWLLVTDGHVISKIQKASAKGAIFSDFNLHDKLAGNACAFSVPIPSEVSEWAMLDSDANEFTSLKSRRIQQSFPR